jgi:hypothetical protein
LRSPGGIVPFSWFPVKSKIVNEDNCERAFGIEPVKLLFDRSKYWRALRFPKEDDISPLKPIFDRFLQREYDQPNFIAQLISSH